MVLVDCVVLTLQKCRTQTDNFIVFYLFYTSLLGTISMYNAAKMHSFFLPTIETVDSQAVLS